MMQRSMATETRIRKRASMRRARLAVPGAMLCLTASSSVHAPINVVLREGTNMAAALSPDGRTIAIDLLGSIWTLPASGGVTKRLTDELMDARQPAWSRDGRRIAFQAYRASTWNIWAIDAGGGNLRQLTWGPYDDREPHWSPDGTRMAFSSDRNGNYDIWVLTVATGQLAPVTTNPANDFMPAWSPDGLEIAFVSHRRESPGVYAVTPHAPPNDKERLIEGVSGAVAGPSWNPDGRSVAYNVIVALKSSLVVAGRNIAGADEDVFPFRPSWISATELLYTADGKIKRRPVAGGPAQTIELTAEVPVTPSDLVPRRRDFGSRGPHPVRGIVHPAISPDGRQIAFVALGDLWLMPVGGGTPRRITSDPYVEMNPAWAPDSKHLVYSSDRAGSMDLWLRDLTTDRDERLTSLPGAEYGSAWSQDGTRVAFLNADSLNIVTVSTRAITSRPVLREPGAPSWSPNGQWIVLSSLYPSSTRFREGTNRVLRISVGGAPERWFDPIPHKSIGMRGDYGPVWSPDGRQMAAIVDGHLTTFAVSPDGEPRGPARELSTELAESPTWTGDSRRILYQTDDRLKLVDVIDGSVREIDPGLTWTRVSARSTATNVIHAGRLWDGRSASVSTNMDIVLDGSRIKSVEQHRDALHAGHVLDASTETVIPGLIEIHSHLVKSYGEVLGRLWLSWGITSVRSPAGNPFEDVEQREAVESGVRIGPRTFMAGDPIDGTRIYYPGGVSIGEGNVQLGQQLERASRLGYDFMKTYVRLPDLLQKRVVEEAHRRGLPVTSHELYPAAAYGADGVEHVRGTSRRGYSPKQSQLNRTYADVVQLLAASRMTITPTVGIQGGFQLQTIRDASWLNDPRMSLYPAPALASWRTLAAQPRAQADVDRRVGLTRPIEKAVFDIVKAGGRITAGTDAPINPYGLSLLMELEQYVAGGLTPVQALQAATSVNAAALGMGGDLGTIEPGKLADLVVVDGNPIVNIRDLRRVKSVVKGGDVFTMEALLKRP